MGGKSGKLLHIGRSTNNGSHSTKSCAVDTNTFVVNTFVVNSLVVNSLVVNSLVVNSLVVGTDVVGTDARHRLQAWQK